MPEVKPLSVILQLCQLAVLLLILWAIKHEVKDRVSLIAHIQSVNRRQYPPLPQGGSAGGPVEQRPTWPGATPNLAAELSDLRATLEMALRQQSETISNIMQKQVEQSSQWHNTMRDVARTMTPAAPNIIQPIYEGPMARVIFSNMMRLSDEVHQLRENTLK